MRTPKGTITRTPKIAKANIIIGSDSQFYVTVAAANGEAVSTGEGYPTERIAIKAYDARRRAVIEAEIPIPTYTTEQRIAAERSHRAKKGD